MEDSTGKIQQEMSRFGETPWGQFTSRDEMVLPTPQHRKNGKLARICNESSTYVTLALA